MYHAGNTDNFYTISKFERDHAKDVYKFTPYTQPGGPEGIECYISPIGISNPNSRLKFNAMAGLGTNTGNGNFNYSHTDFKLPGIGMPLVFGRTYKSLNYGADGPLGHGWTHSYQAKLIDDGTKIFVFWPTGNADYYVRNGGDPSASSPIRGENPGCYDTLYMTGSDTYTITKKDQSQYVFKLPELSNTPGGAANPFDAGQLISMTDRNENSIIFSYDPYNGKLKNVTDTAGRNISFDYFSPSNKHIKRVDFPESRSINFAYDSDENLTLVNDAKGNPTSYEYDSNHQLTKIILPERQSITNRYDSGFKVDSQTVDNKIFNFTFGINSTTVTNHPAGNPTTYDLTENQLYKITDPYTYGSYFYYNDIKNITKPTTVKNKNGHETYFTYDDGSGDTNKQVLNRGNTLTVTNALNEKTSMVYDERNNLIKKTDARTHSTNFSYDTNKRNLTQVTLPEGGMQNFTYTTKGQIETATDPNIVTVTYDYDSQGNLLTITDDLGYSSGFTYDGVGRKLTSTNQLGRNTSFAYDKNDNLTTIINAESKTIINQYDMNDNLITLSNTKNNPFSYIYNDQNRLASESDPLNMTFRYEYDTVGNLKYMFDPDNNTLQNVYDTNYQRLSETRYNDDIKISIPEYDSIGNIKRISYDGKSTKFQYDELNRIRSVEDGFGNVVSYVYDKVGNISKIVYPGLKEVNYIYDNDNRLKEVWDWLAGKTEYFYDAAGLLEKAVNPNGTQTIYKYDTINRLVTLSNLKSDNSTISNYIYTLDAVGNHTQEAADEPLLPTLTPGSTGYTVDDANRILTAGPVSYTHDNRGNLTSSSDGSSYQYDYADRLTFTNRNGKNISYKYNAMGNRISRTENGVTRYVLDLNGSMSQVLMETNASGNPIAYYVYGHGLISRITPGNQKYFYHYDSRGSTIAITDSSQNIVNKYAYDDFGKVVAIDEAPALTNNPFKYVGKYGVMDEENGLLFMRARFYNVVTGKFMNKDPMGFEGGDYNLYAYVGNNSTMSIDPEGLWFKKTVIFAAKAYLDLPSTLYGLVS